MVKQIEIACPEVMDIAVVSELHQRLRDQLGRAEPLCLVADKVERVDTACLQLLAALFLDAAARQVPVAWSAPSKQLREAAGLLGLQDVLGLAPDT